MSRLRLGAIVEDRPVRMNIELPAALHRDLLAYAAMHGEENGQPTQPAERLVAPMLAMFIGSDRAFAKRRRPGGATEGSGS